MSTLQSTRVDRWLWAIRLYRTRSLATDACRGGHVKVNGTTAKPATPVRVGDRVTASAFERHRDFEVVGIIDRRVAAALAAECYLDHSPPPPPRDHAMAAFMSEAGSGRPTKRDRRQLDRLRRR